VKWRIDRADDAALEEMYRWRYEPPYEFYNGDEEEPVGNPERYFFTRGEDGRVAGFYYFEPKGDVLEYGLGLRPDLTGRGLGLEFFRCGLEFGRGRYGPRLVRLYVAAFNARAITVYERAGFRETDRHVRSFENWGDVEFVQMDELS
jgi:ribosomal-protein-alanine N-acetyltransferase